MAALVRSIARPVARSVARGNAVAGGAPLLMNLALTSTSSEIAVDFDTSRTGDNYSIYVQSPPGATPSEGDIYAGTGAAWHTTFGPLAIDTVIPGPSGLLPSTSYRVYVIGFSGSAYSNTLTGDTTTLAPDVTAPILSGASLIVVDETTLAPSVTTDEGNGTMYWVLTQSASVPSAAQIIAGNDHTGTAADASDTFSVLASGAQAMSNISGLSSANTYYLHAIQDDDSANRSNIASSAGGQPADITAPILSSPIATEDGANAMAGSVNSDTADGTVYAVITQSNTSPSAAQVAAGQDHAGATAAASTSQAAAALGNNTFSISGLADDTTYYAHYMHRDAASNDSAVATSAAFTTDSLSILAQYLAAGVDDLTAKVNLTVKASAQTDPDGGANAVEFTNNGAGGVMRMTAACTFNNGDNYIRATVKLTNVGASIGLPVEFRFATVSVTSIGAWDFNITAGTTSSPGATITSLGSGWYELQAYIDMTGDADLAGFATLTPNELNTASGDMEFLAYDFSVATT